MEQINRAISKKLPCNITAGKAYLYNVERIIAKEIPELHDLTPEQIEEIAKRVIIGRYTAKMNKGIDLAEIDYAEEKVKFLKLRKSKYTARNYNYAFSDFEQYMRDYQHKTPLECTPAIADDYILHMKAEDKSNALIRLSVAAMSSFFNHIGRYHNAIRNPFIGTKALPKKVAKKRIEDEIPTTDLELFGREIKTIIETIEDKELKVMAYIMAYRGLRCGSFQSMTFHGDKFFAASKGNDISGMLPAICLQAIKEEGIKRDRPFANWKTEDVSSKFKYHVSKLFRAGRISYRYSCHDLRHFYAMTKYTETKDIYGVSKLLGHSNISTTETYLRGLKVLEN